MSDHLRRFAGSLEEPAPTPDEIATILDLARDIAHGTERKLAPVTAYLVGLHVGRRIAAGDDRDEALRAAVQRILDALADAPDTPDDA